MFTIYLYCVLVNLVVATLWQRNVYRRAQTEEVAFLERKQFNSLLFKGWALGAVLSLTGPIYTALCVFSIILGVVCRWWMNRQIAAGRL